MHYDSDGDSSDAAGDDSGNDGAVMEMLVMTVVMTVTGDADGCDGCDTAVMVLGAKRGRRHLSKTKGNKANFDFCCKNNKKCMMKAPIKSL